MTDEGLIQSTPTSRSTEKTMASLTTLTSSDSGFSNRCDSSGHSAEGTIDTIEQYGMCLNDVLKKQDTENHNNTDMCNGKLDCNDQTDYSESKVYEQDNNRLKLIINDNVDKTTSSNRKNGCEDNKMDTNFHESSTFKQKVDSNILSNMSRRFVMQMKQHPLYRLSRSRSSSVERGGDSSKETSPAKAPMKPLEDLKLSKILDHPLARLSRSRSSSAEKDTNTRKNKKSREGNEASNCVKNDVPPSVSKRGIPSFCIPPPPPVTTSLNEPSIIDGLRSRHLLRNKRPDSSSYRYSNPEVHHHYAEVDKNQLSQSSNVLNSEMKITKVMRNALSWNGVLGQHNKCSSPEKRKESSTYRPYYDCKKEHISRFKNVYEKENIDSTISVSLPTISSASTHTGGSPERSYKKKRQRSRSVEIINKMKQDSSTTDSEEEQLIRQGTLYYLLSIILLMT